MKRETMEYNYDWMMWSILDPASKAYDGTQKEYESLLPLVPHFRDVLETVIKQGESGVLLLKLMARYVKNCLTAHDEGKKVAITTFCFATPILHAFDVVPIPLETMTVLGSFILKRDTSEYLDYCCELGFTETSCSAQRGALGAYLAGLGVKPDFIVCDSPGICDTNANSFAFASAYLDIPFYQLNYPPAFLDESAKYYHREDFKNLITFLEEQTGSRLDIDRLREIIEEIKKQDELACELLELQRLKPDPVPGIYGVFLYGGKFMMNGTRIFTELLESMVKKAKENARLGIAGTSSGREKARGLFFYIDHYTTDMRFWDWLDKNEISHLGSLLSTFWQKEAPYAVGREDEGYCIDTSSMDSMIDSLAEQTSRMPMIKQIRGPYDAPHMWLDDTLGMAKLLNPDFAVYMGSMGCRNTGGMVKLIARDLEREGIPTLIVFADSFDDRVASWESIMDRIGEFLHVRRIGIWLSQGVM